MKLPIFFTPYLAIFLTFLSFFKTNQVHLLQILITCNAYIIFMFYLDINNVSTKYAPPKWYDDIGIIFRFSIFLQRTYLFHLSPPYLILFLNHLLIFSFLLFFYPKTYKLPKRISFDSLQVFGQQTTGTRILIWEQYKIRWWQMNQISSL